MQCGGVQSGRQITTANHITRLHLRLRVCYRGVSIENVARVLRSLLVQMNLNSDSNDGNRHMESISSSDRCLFGLSPKRRSQGRRHVFQAVDIREHDSCLSLSDEAMVEIMFLSLVLCCARFIYRKVLSTDMAQTTHAADHQQREIRKHARHSCTPNTLTTTHSWASACRTSACLHDLQI